MKTYKYYYKVTSENGKVIFDHKSNSVKRLLTLYEKEAYSSDGNIYCDFFFGKHETNITDELAYAVACGCEF